MGLFCLVSGELKLSFCYMDSFDFLGKLRLFISNWFLVKVFRVYFEWYYHWPICNKIIWLMSECRFSIRYLHNTNVLSFSIALLCKLILQCLRKYVKPAMLLLTLLFYQLSYKKQKIKNNLLLGLGGFGHSIWYISIKIIIINTNQVDLMWGQDCLNEF